MGIVALTLIIVLGWLSYRLYSHGPISIPVAATDTLPPRDVPRQRRPSVESVSRILNIPPEDTSYLTR
ncbi:MAG: hypothetical protein K2N86_03150 [Rikenellaceae bacterium]|nr:hypothetical protein [Rikenellaceae bacterium]